MHAGEGFRQQLRALDPALQDAVLARRGPAPARDVLARQVYNGVEVSQPLLLDPTALRRPADVAAALGKIAPDQPQDLVPLRFERRQQMTAEKTVGTGDENFHEEARSGWNSLR